MKSSYELLSDLTASAVNIPDCFYHGDAEFIEFGASSVQKLFTL